MRLPLVPVDQSPFGLPNFPFRVNTKIKKRKTIIPFFKSSQNICGGIWESIHFEIFYISFSIGFLQVERKIYYFDGELLHFTLSVRETFGSRWFLWERGVYLPVFPPFLFSFFGP